MHVARHSSLRCKESQLLFSGGVAKCGRKHDADQVIRHEHLLIFLVR